MLDAAPAAASAISIHQLICISLRFATSLLSSLSSHPDLANRPTCCGVNLLTDARHCRCLQWCSVLFLLFRAGRLKESHWRRMLWSRCWRTGTGRIDVTRRQSRALSHCSSPSWVASALIHTLWTSSPMLWRWPVALERPRLLECSPRWPLSQVCTFYYWNL